ncbi:MAG: transposase [bacterium]|jgi:hypothetical protein
MEFKGPLCTAVAGFSLHAARRVGSEDRRGLSQLIHYVARPPLAEDRLERTAGGDILYKLKQPWDDGTVGIQLSPSVLIEKLIALIPPRSSPLVRYGGVFAPNFKHRDEVILVPGRRKRKVSVGLEVGPYNSVDLARPRRSQLFAIFLRAHTRQKIAFAWWHSLLRYTTSSTGPDLYA